MGLWTGRLVVLGAALFALGWVLVLASGHGGNSTGGSEVVWQIGGLMVYVCFPVFAIAALIAVAGRFRRS